MFDGFLVAKKKTEGFLILLQRYFYPDLKFYREIVRNIDRFGREFKMAIFGLTSSRHQGGR